ncbi:hypothetical protein DOY81_009358, partial [Sarcophaga bullata]
GSNPKTSAVRKRFARSCTSYVNRRLRDLYQGDIMADNTVAGFGKDPLATSHGDALADQSFQSLKSKEIRDSLSPTEMKFQSMALKIPTTPVGMCNRVEHINGGTAEFKGRNEQRSSAHHEGDDKNFVKKAMESSNSHLQEKVVIGDENSGRTEVRTSSSKSTSSSQVFQSSTNVEYEDGYPVQSNQPQKYLMDSPNRHYQPHDLHQRQLHEEQRLREEQRLYEQQFQQQRQQQQHERRTTEQMTSTQRQNTEQKNVTQNVQTQETHEQNKRYVDMDKASPEYQQHVQHLMQQPGEIISNTVEYPKPNVKMITTVKRLPDGTIVRNKRYETEEVAPSSGPSNRPTSSAPNQTQIRRDSQQPQQQPGHPGQPGRYYQPDVAAPSPHRPNEDMVDSATTTRYVHDTHNDDVETKVTSSVKKSSRKFSTETTSETIQEYDDRYPQGGEPSSRPRPQTNDFSTHGFPSVRPNKPTQEYPTERPRPSPQYTNQATPKPNEAVVPQHYTDAVDNVSERRIPTDDGGEIIIVSSEKKRNYKTQTNSERVVETEHIVKDDQQDFTTQGFPSVREPVHQPKMYPSERQIQPHEQDFPLDKLPPGARITRPSNTPINPAHTSKYNTNTERVIEHEIIRDDQGYPRSPQHVDNMPYTVTTPGDQQPHGEFPGSPRKPSNVDYSTQGFPSARTPTKGEHTPQGEYPGSPRTTPGSDFSTQGFPSTRTPSKPQVTKFAPAGISKVRLETPNQGYSTQGFPSVRTPAQGHPSNGTAEPNRTTPSSKTPQPRTPSPNKYKTPSSTTTTTRETTERVIRKEKEVDSAHRALCAAPLHLWSRSGEIAIPLIRIQDIHQDQVFLRAPSETSRISTTTVTRNTPPRTVGGRTVVTRVVTTKTGLGSNDSLTKTTPRGSTKSPSPGKTVTTTTTTTTRTSGKAPTPSRDVPKSTDNQHTRISTTTTSSIPINATPQTTKPQPLTTTLTKIQISDNHKLPTHSKKFKSGSKRNPAPIFITSNDANVVEEIIEKPCIKKNYYKLGLSEPPSLTIQKQENAAAIATSKPYKLSQTSVYPSPLSPSFRSRKPQTIAPNDTETKTPQDDWQTRNKPVTDIDDERRTVQRETTFEKNEKDSGPTTRPFDETEKPREPSYQPQPNVEWVIVDDVDIEDHDDDDDFTTEVVDSREHLKKTTRNLIVNEKRTPLAPLKGQKTPLNNTDKTRKPVTSKPNDKVPNQGRPQKSLPDSRSPLRTPTKSQPKAVDTKPITKPSPKPSLPSYTSPLRKPVGKVPSDVPTTTKRTVKTSSQVIKDTTTRLIADNRISGRPTKQPQPQPQSPATTPSAKYPEPGTEDDTITITELRKHNKEGTQSPFGTPESVQERPYIFPDQKYPNEPFGSRPQSPEKHTPKDSRTPVRNPEVTSGRRQQSPEKQTPKDSRTPVRNQEKPGERYPEEPFGRRPQSPEKQTPKGYKSPVRNQEKPGQKYPEVPSGRRPQSPEKQTPKDSKTPARSHEKPGQKYPEAPSGRRPQSPSKPLSPTRTPKKPMDIETSRTNVNTKKLFFEEYPQKTGPKGRKPLDSEDDETVIESTVISSTKKLITTEQEIQEIEKLRDSKSPLRVQEKPDQQYPEEPFAKRPHSPNRFDSPSRSPVKEQPGQKLSQSPNQNLPRENEPLDTDEEETFVETTEFVVIAKKEKLIKPDDNTPTTVGDLPKPVCQLPREPSGKRPQSPSKPVSPTRTTKKPVDDKTPLYPKESKPKGGRPLDTETQQFVINTTKKLITTEQETLEKKFPRDSKSPQRLQEKPDQKYPEEPSGGRSQSPTKPVSPNRLPKKPEERKPKGLKPLDTDDEQTFVETSELVINTTKKLITTEQEFQETDKPYHPGKKQPKDTKSPENLLINILKTQDYEYPEETRPFDNDDKPSGRYPSPSRLVSPSRLPKEPQPSVNDQTFRKTLRTDKEPHEAAPTTQPKPKGQKPKEPTDTDSEEEETFTETNETVIKYTQKRVVTQEEETLEAFEQPKYPGDKRVSPLREQPKQRKLLDTEDDDTCVVTSEFIINTSQKRTLTETDEPVRGDSPTRSQRKPQEPQKPKHVSPTSLRSEKIITEKTTKKFTDDKPKDGFPGSDRPTDTDEEEYPKKPTDFIKDTTQKLIVSEQQIPDIEKKPKKGLKEPLVPENYVTETVTITTTQKFDKDDYPEGTIPGQNYYK